MDQEIAQVEQAYQNNLQRLQQYVASLEDRIRRWRIQVFIRNYYLRYVRRWYDQQKQALDRTRTDEIAAIRQRYSKPDNRKKKACLVGINYVGSQYALNGCVNDVYKFRELLITKYGYNSADIRLLTNKAATRANILAEFVRLLREAVAGDSLCFSFSGHGVYIRDRNGDEGDGQDELIVSADFYGIIDDEFKAIINRYLKPGVQLFALFDNCHSGTILDLKYQHLKAGAPQLKVHNNTNETAGQVVCISGCRDDQVSMDAYLEGKYNGAMTWALVETLSQTNAADLTWENGLTQLRNKLQSRGFAQRPQLTSGQTLAIGQTKITL